MEILRTSDAMESQILEDARNKARRLLEAADKECSAVRAEWQRTLQEESRPAGCRPRRAARRSPPGARILASPGIPADEARIHPGGRGGCASGSVRGAFGRRAEPNRRADACACGGRVQGDAGRGLLCGNERRRGAADRSGKHPGCDRGRCHRACRRGGRIVRGRV